MRELQKIELDMVAGGTAFPDPNSPWWQLEQGQDTSEMRLGTVVVTPEGALYSAAGIGVNDTASSDVNMPSFPFDTEGMGFFTALGTGADNPFTIMGYWTDLLLAQMSDVDGMSIHPDGPGQIFDFEGCNMACPW